VLSSKSFLRLFSPPYIFQPLQALKRLRLEYFGHSEQQTIVTLPWGLSIRVNLREAIGYNIACQGLYEPGVTETLWRLTEPGELVVDAGANIGYTTSILAIRVGRAGRILSFEPHPQVFECLTENAGNWRADERCGTIVLAQAALGERNGTGALHTDGQFATNRGSARMENDLNDAVGSRVIPVTVHTLDSVINVGEQIGVLKMDVQGSEFAVLKGMTGLLERRDVRDIVFEEEAGFPAPTHNYLESKGYSIFGIQELFSRVRCIVGAAPHPNSDFGPIPNYLATRDPERAVARLSPRIWRSFGFGRVLPDLAAVKRLHVPAE
jgi:FkbM family methyltransferase